MGPSRQQSSQLADGKILNWQCSNLADCVSWTRPRFSTSMNQPHIGGVTQPCVSAMDVNTVFNTAHDGTFFIQQDDVAVEVSLGLTWSLLCETTEDFFTREQNRCAAQSKLSGDTGTGDVKPVRTNPCGAWQVRKYLLLQRSCIGHLASAVCHNPQVVLRQKNAEKLSLHS